MSVTSAFRTRVQRPFALHSRPADDDNRNGDTERCCGDERHGRSHRGRQDQQNGDRQHGLYDLAGGALPDHGPKSAADVAHLAAMVDAPMHIAGDATG
jgi:hypothetical protein